LEYLEEKFGADKYREFLRKISSNDVNFIRQPVDGAFTYPDSILALVDKILLEDYLDNDLEEFRNLGRRSADNFIYRFFGLYVESSQPVDFLAQYARLRNHLIGSGEMEIEVIDITHIDLIIDYGQKIPKSVCLSEQGFLAGGMELCGARDVRINELICASESDTFSCKFSVSFTA
jgi:predicted hydrocarbon binding protein